jgi:hypothetical protein
MALDFGFRKTGKRGKIGRHGGPNRLGADHQPMNGLFWTTQYRGDNMSNDQLPWENQVMNEYEVTFINGEVLEVEAWTPTIAQAIAEEEADLNGHPLAVVSVKFLRLQSAEG